MAIQPSVMIKSKGYEGTRLTIAGSYSSNQYLHYAEASGNRYYVNEISATQSDMGSVTFDAFLSFTASNATPWQFDLVPMQPGQSLIIDNFIVEGFKSDGTAQFLMQAFGGYRYSTTTLSKSGINYQYINDGLTGATAYFTASGTTSVSLVISGVAATNIDFDVHIRYIKSYHTLLNTSSGGGAWFPDPIIPTA